MIKVCAKYEYKNKNGGEGEIKIVVVCQFKSTNRPRLTFALNTKGVELIGANVNLGRTVVQNQPAIQTIECAPSMGKIKRINKN